MGALLALDSVYCVVNGSCGSLEMDVLCLLSKFDCSLGQRIVFLFAMIASSVSGESVYVLSRFRMSLQSLEGLVLYKMVLRSCFHVVCCSCRISSSFSSFNVFMRLIISGVRRWCLWWFLVLILCSMFLLNPGLNYLIAQVGIYCLLLCVIAVLWLQEMAVYLPYR